MGNNYLLGNWMPVVGLQLSTNQKNYPLWENNDYLMIEPGTNLEFKLIVMNNCY